MYSARDTINKFHLIVNVFIETRDLMHGEVPQGLDALLYAKKANSSKNKI